MLDHRGHPPPAARPTTIAEDPRLRRVLRFTRPAIEDGGWIVAWAFGVGGFAFGFAAFVVATDHWFDARGAGKFASFPYAAPAGFLFATICFVATRRYDLLGARRRERAGLLDGGRCGFCRYELSGPQEDDGCVVCTECGGAWQVPRSAGAQDE
ncbi:MAG: hypothetical protein CMJ31_12470 [Phycisphaerae bacterium]|nr:hypothetical protein [Phycisphaerae bacterium]